MNRDCFCTLITWKNRPRRKPLLLRGARQVGKSWLIKELGRNFDSFVEINFEEEPGLKSIFEGSLNPNEIIINLANYFNTKIIPQKTLLFFDEIQEVPQAIMALRYFYEKMPELHVIAAGSLIEFELSKSGFPVGRVELLYVKPLSYGEFLDAIGESDFRKSMAAIPPRKIPEALHQKQLKLVRDYTLIGGMPEVVKTFVETKDINECQKILSSLVEVFKKDFSKYAKKKMITHVSLVFDSIPRMTGRKFVWSHVNNQVKSTVLATALDLLEKAGLVHKIYHTNSSGVPLGSGVNPRKFKVLFFDLGLAQRMLGTDIKSLILNPDISQINNGELAELFAGLELLKYQSPYFSAELFYWHREENKSNSEIDYLFSKESSIYPVEVKSGSTGRLKSLNIFLKLKKIKTGFKISQMPFSNEHNIHCIPFYAIESWYKNL